MLFLHRGTDNSEHGGLAAWPVMQDRLNHNDVTNRINVEDPQRVRDAVLGLFNARFPGADFTPLSRAFDDFAALFEGRYPGYLACDTLYHDIRHTLDMTLAMARLVDGTSAPARPPTGWARGAPCSACWWRCCTIRAI